MKARIKETGEIVNIYKYAEVELDMCDSYGNPITKRYDEVEILQDKEVDKAISDEQIRIEALKLAIEFGNDIASNEDRIIIMANKFENYIKNDDNK